MRDKLKRAEGHYREMAADMGEAAIDATQDGLWGEPVVKVRARMAARYAIAVVRLTSRDPYRWNDGSPLSVA